MHACIYPSRQGGVFIPCNENEIRIVAEQVFKRIIQELTNLEGTVAPTSILQLITSAKQEMERLERQI